MRFIFYLENFVRFFRIGNAARIKKGRTPGQEKRAIKTIKILDYLRQCASI
jgi:hypothetical protein